MAGENNPKSTSGKVTAPAAKVFQCPNCAASVELRAVGLSVSAVCRACSSIISTTDENYQILEKVSRAMKREPLIPLGRRGKIKGTTWEVIGYMERSDASGAYVWSEYLLFNPTKRFHWLTEFAGHWNFVLTTKNAPTIDSRWTQGDVRDVATYLGQEYLLFHRGSAKVVFVLGEFYWQVKLGDSTRVEDYVRPPEVLSSQKSDSEVIWSLGEYIESDVIRDAFKIEQPMPLPIGVAPNQLSTLQSTVTYTQYLWAAFVCILLAIQFLQILRARNETVLSSAFMFTSLDSDKVKVSQPFVLKKDVANVRVDLSAPVKNNWLEVQGELVNDDTGQTFNFEQGIEFYSGYDSDGSWTEGSTATDTDLSAIPAGNYHLNLEISGPTVPAITSPPPEPVSPVAPLATQDSTGGAVVSKTFWPDGKVKSEEFVLNQQIVGLAKYYHENGELQSEVRFVDGKKDGRARQYLSDGRLEVEQHYKDGELNGLSKRFDANGNLHSLEEYSRGSLVSSRLVRDMTTPTNSQGVTVSIKRDVVTWSNFLWAILLLSVYPIFVLWRGRSFEVSRWSTSDFSPYYNSEWGGDYE
jgi:hypothetical protein